jgi:hypothetical protein
MVESGNLKENLWKILIKLSFMMLEVSSLDVDLGGYLFPFRTTVLVAAMS